MNLNILFINAPLMASTTIIMLAFFGFLFIVVFMIYRFVFSAKKQELKTTQTVPVCPRCGTIAEKGSENFAEVFDPSRHRCPNCSYEGVFLDIIPDNLAKFRKHLKTNTDYSSQFKIKETE